VWQVPQGTDWQMSGPSKDERRELLRAFEKLMPQKRGENENVGSLGKTRRHHQAEYTLLAGFRDAKSISGSKVECRVYYLSGKLKSR